jgi:hypothetical protein
VNWSGPFLELFRSSSAPAATCMLQLLSVLRSGLQTKKVSTKINHVAQPTKICLFFDNYDYKVSSQREYIISSEVYEIVLQSKGSLSLT